MTFKQAGQYKWVMRSVIHDPEKLRVKTYVCKTIQKFIPKKKKTIYKRKANLYREDVGRKFIPPKEMPVIFKGKAIRPSQKIIAPVFAYKDNSRYNISYLNKSHGFVSDNILAIAEDNEKNIWIATFESGLVRYDGSYLYMYNMDSGLISNSITDMKFDGSSGLWIATNEGVQIIRNDSIFEPTIASAKNRDLNIARVNIDTHHNIWVNTLNHGALRFNMSAGTTQQFDTLCGLPHNEAQCTIIDRYNNYWFAGIGLVKVEGSKITQWYSRKDYLNSDQSLTLLEDADTIWVGTFDNSIYKITARDTTQYAIDSNFIGRVYELNRSRGMIWFTLYGQGVGYMQGDDLMIFNETNGLSGAAAYRMLTDSYDNIWIGTVMGGMSRINELCIFADNNAPQFLHTASKIRLDKKGNRWYFLNGGGIVKETPDGYEIITNEPKKPLPSVWYFMDGILNDDGTAWLPTYSSGIAHYTPKEITFYYYSDEPEDRVGIDAERTPDGRAWFSTLSYGLLFMSGTNFYHLTSADGLLTDKESHLERDKNGTLLCTSGKGLQKISGDTIYDLYLNNKRFECSVNSFCSRADAYIMSTSDKGLIMMKDGRLSIMPASTEIDYLSITCILEDGAEGLWLTNKQGIIRCRLDRISISDVRLFSARDGIMLSTIDYPCYIDDHNVPHWSTNEGFLVFKAEFENKKTKAPNIKYLRATLNGADVDLKQMPTLFPNDELKIYYTIICWGNENQLTQEYALVNMRGKDTIVSPIGEKGVFKFNNLNAGEYRILLRATIDQSKYYSEALPLTVRPYWYNTIWFWSICVIIVLLGVFIFFRIRSKRLQRSKLQLERIVSQRTAELTTSLAERDILLKEVHHRVKNNLQVIIGLLELQKEEMTDEKVKAALSEGQSRVRSIALIHHNLYQHESLATIQFKLFANDLAKYLAEVFEEKNRKLKVDIAGENVALDIDTGVPLGLIINELLTNAYKHATSKKGMTEVVLELKRIGKGEYELVYIDNGPGIKPEINFDTATSLGLRLIKGLIAQISGTVRYTYIAGSVFVFTFKDGEARRKE